MMAEVFGSSDCERFHTGFLRQPVNALSSLAFLPAGWAVLRAGPGRTELALTTMSVGVSSFLAHGPGGRFAHWFHDASIAWLLTALARPPGWIRWAIHGTVGWLFARAPSVRKPLSILLAGWAFHRVFRNHRSDPAFRRAAAVAGLATLIGNLSRTGGPLCRPDSLLQGHAVWHVLAALALARFGAAPWRTDDR
jgi:hypothetical protein